MIEREIDRLIPIPSALVVNIESKMLSPAPASSPVSGVFHRNEDTIIRCVQLGSND
jgi:hypothetical protein